MFGTDLWVICAGASLLWSTAWSLVMIIRRVRSVSYTHLDVYKRQLNATYAE